MSKINFIKIFIVMLCSMLLVMCPVAAYANILDGTKYTYDGKLLTSELPEEVYCQNYILISQSGKNFYLIILEDGDTATISGTGGNSSVITFTGWTEGYTRVYLNYDGTREWSDVTTVNNNSSYTLTPPNIYILESTIDLYKTGDPSTLLYAKNADILHPETDTGGDNTGGDSGDDPTDTPVDFEPTTFAFIADPQTSTDMIYNLLLMDSMAAFTYLGYRAIKTVFARIRRFRNYKRGDK